MTSLISKIPALDLKAIRVARKLTQDEIGRIIGVNQKRVARIEKNPDSVSFGQLKVILAALGCEVTLQLKDGWKSPALKEGFSSVYILVHLKLPLFKIGKANDIEFRLKMLGYINLSASYKFITDSESSAFRVERILHRTFHKWRLSHEQSLEMGVVDNGATEWFQLDCLDRLLDFAKNNSDLLGFEIMPVQ